MKAAKPPVRSPSDLLVRQIIQPAEKSEILFGSQLVVKDNLFSDQTNMLSDLARFPDYVKTDHPGAALGGTQQRAEHPYRSRFAGPVRAKESKYHPFSNFEGDVVYGCEIAKALGQSLNFNYAHLLFILPGSSLPQ